MIDLRIIREDPEGVKAAIATTFTDAPIDEILAADERRRVLLTDVETLKAELNQGSKQVGRTKNPDERQALIARMRELGDRISALDETVKAAEGALQQLMLRVPNIPLPHVPVSPDESGNVVLAEHGARREFAFARKAHWELDEGLGIIDFERGVKMAGTGC